MKGWKWVIALVLVAGQVMAAAPVGARPVPGVTCPTGSAQVVLDPGHGGSDTGAINQQYGLLEKNLTLAIATRAAEILQANGYTVALTRSTDVSLGNSERGAIANACGASVFVEIHLNGSNDPNVNYTQTFWGKKRKDLAFSQTMSEALTALGIPNNGVAQFANGGLLTATAGY